MKCPFCSKDNPSDSKECECGYKFKGYNPETSANFEGAKNKLTPQNVVIKDIRMDFIDMVTFMVKWAIASIPAFIILWVIGLLVGSILIGLFGGIGALLN